MSLLPSLQAQSYSPPVHYDIEHLPSSNIKISISWSWLEYPWTLIQSLSQCLMQMYEKISASVVRKWGLESSMLQASHPSSFPRWLFHLRPLCLPYSKVPHSCLTYLFINLFIYCNNYSLAGYLARVNFMYAMYDVIYGDVILTNVMLIVYLHWSVLCLYILQYEMYRWILFECHSLSCRMLSVGTLSRWF